MIPEPILCAVPHAAGGIKRPAIEGAHKPDAFVAILVYNLRFGFKVPGRPGFRMERRFGTGRILPFLANSFFFIESQVGGTLASVSRPGIANDVLSRRERMSDFSFFPIAWITQV